MTHEDLRRLSTREEVVSAIRDQFPHLSSEDVALSPTLGGRAAALGVLAGVKPEGYARSRNYLDGDVTRLSAYLRHGVLTLAEVRDHVLASVKMPEQGGKLVNELAWRDYWQRLYFGIGEGIWEDREAYKTGFRAGEYAEELPGEIPGAATTLACMDGFAQELRETGYLHNHARMWTAAYVVHWRRVRWQAGAAWFLEHLVDGDPASNNLSWQWVASTFASKPYFFNRENLQRYTANRYCAVCPHAQARTCPFEGEYEDLEQTLFPRLHAPADAGAMPTPPRPFAAVKGRASSPQVGGKPLLWIHTDALNPASPMLLEHPERPAVFVWDLGWITGGEITLKRLVFLAECLREMPVEVELRIGDPGEELLAAARASGADYVLAQRTPDPRLLAAAQAVEKVMPVVWYDPPAFVDETRAFELKRFSRYWQRAQTSAMQPTRER